MLKSINKTISFILELAMLAAFGYAGFHIGSHKVIHYCWGIGFPLLVIIYWANFMAPKAPNRLPFPWLHLVTLWLFETSAMALYGTHITKWAIAFAILALINIGIRLMVRSMD